MCVPPALVKRCKNHFHNLLCGASIILGNNGYIWISSQESTDHQLAQKHLRTSTASTSPLVVSESKEQRKIIARLRNCISALAQNKVMIFDTTIQYTYEASLKFKVGISYSDCAELLLMQVRELLIPSNIKEIIEPATRVDTV